MVGKFSIPLVGILIILFGVSGILDIVKKPELSQGQALLIGVSYTLVILSGFGVIKGKNWARMLIVSISAVGFIIQVLELRLSFDIKDIIQALLFAFFIAFFSNRLVKEELN